MPLQEHLYPLKVLGMNHGVVSHGNLMLRLNLNAKKFYHCTSSLLRINKSRYSMNALVLWTFPNYQTESAI